jgi:serine/threonine-protein kinase HipA
LHEEGDGGLWCVAPGYDLTFNEGPGGFRQMDVCGEAKRIERAHLLDLSSKAGLGEAEAVAVIEQVCEAAGHLPEAVRNMPISAETQHHIGVKVAQSCALVGLRT